MRYIKVEWLHEQMTEPVVLYSEVDDERYEVRKVEVYWDGRVGWAGQEGRSGDTALGQLPIPDLREMDAQEFHPQDISEVEFESVWNGATASAG